MFLTQSCKLTKKKTRRRDNYKFWKLDNRRIVVTNLVHSRKQNFKKKAKSQAWWHIPLIPSTQEAEADGFL